MERRRLLLTGASGFVGTAMAPMLAAEGWDVVPGRRGELVEAIAGCEAVVHLAGRAHVMREEAVDLAALYRRDNTELALDLGRAAAAAGVRRFVLMSTGKVFGEGRDRPYTEADPSAPQDDYARSKLAAEDGLFAVGRDTGMEIVVLRPPLIYGPGVRANFLSLVRAVDKGMPLPLGLVRNSRSLISVANLAAAVVTALTHPGAVGRVFPVADGEDVSTPDLIRRIAGAIGKPVRLIPIPVAILRAAAALLGQGRAVDRLAGSLTLDPSGLMDLGWTRAETLEHGLHALVKWYLSRDSISG